MKKTLIALAAFAAVSTSFAQSTVSMVGAFRAGILNNDAGTKTTPNQGSGNQINFKVSEDLGGGMKFNAATQLRFTSETGAFNADRAGFQTTSIGFSGGFGTLETGRIGLDQLWGYNPYGSNGAHTNVSGVGGATENGQIRYTSPSMGGLKVALSTTMKNNGNAVNGNQLLISYSAGPLSATYVQETTGEDLEYTGLGASYDLGVAKVMMISASAKKADNTKSADGMSVGVAVPMGAVVLKAGFLNDKLAANKDKTSIGIDYALSKRTTLEADFYKTKGDATGQNTWIGVRHSF